MLEATFARQQNRYAQVDTAVRLQKCKGGATKNGLVDSRTRIYGSRDILSYCLDHRGILGHHWCY